MRQRLGIAQAIAGDPRLIIVDEPTAGLDPEERLRFYRLLSELAEERIVLLSTHIVEDVAVLCPRFAVIRHGRLVANTTPEQARRAIEGTIFEGSIPAASYEQLVADPERCVTQAYLVEGSNRVRVYQPEGDPPGGFAPVDATLEDAYLVVIKTGGLPGRRHRRRLDRGRRSPEVCHEPGRRADGRSPRSLQPSLRRFWTVFAGDVAYHARRPLFWIWALILVLGAWGMSTGSMQIQSGDTTVGGTKA